MKTEQRIVRTTFYYSEVDPDFETDSAAEGKTLAWADEHAREAYALVRGSKSKLYGEQGSVHHDSLRGPNPSAHMLVRRLVTFEDDARHAQPFWRERAAFALAYHKDRTFRTGFFQQHAAWTDGKEYARACVELEYTTDLKGMIVDRFVAWMDPAFPETTRITVDDEEVRRYGHLVDGVYTPVPRASTRKTKAKGK